MKFWYSTQVFPTAKHSIWSDSNILFGLEANFNIRSKVSREFNHLLSPKEHFKKNEKKFPKAF